MEYVLIVSGVLLLFGGGELLVRYASVLGRRVGMSSLLVGLTIVSFGTSAPELAATMSAALRGATDMAFGNVVGSNIANVGLVLGLVALLTPITASRRIVRFDAPVMLAICLLLGVLSLDGSLGVQDGALMCVTLLVFLVLLFRADAAPDEDLDEGPTSLALVSVGIVAGLAGLVFGADLLVEGAVTVARAFDVSERVIGLTLMAVGTSLPELASSLVAAYRGEVDLLVGNVVGSNIFNVLVVLGFTSLINPIPIDVDVVSPDLIVMLAFALSLWVGLSLRRRLFRLEGLVLLSCYFGYISTL